MITLRPYQEEAVQELQANPHRLLADEQGLGKTLVTLCALSKFPALVVAPKVAMGVWADEAGKVGLPPLIYQGPAKHREAKMELIQDLMGDTDLIVIVSYGLMHELTPLKWGTIIFDECHKLRNRQTITFKSATHLAKKGQATYLLTGTPVVSGPQDLWSYLTLIGATKSGYWDWLKTHMITHQIEGRGTEIIGPKSPVDFQHYIYQYMTRRTKAEVNEQLPPKIRQAIPIDMTNRQRAIYRDLWDDLIAEGASGDLIIAPNRIASITKVRQLLVAPALLGYTEPSPAIEAAKDLVANEVEQGNSVIIFTPFIKALDLIAEALFKVCPTYVLAGADSATKVVQTISRFQHEDKPAALVASLMTATSYTATKASTAIFVGYDWSPHINYQAEDRIHRIGQERGVRCLYITYRQSIDSHILDILDSKVSVTRLTIDPTVFQGSVALR